MFNVIIIHVRIIEIIQCQFNNAFVVFLKIHYTTFNKSIMLFYIYNSNNMCFVEEPMTLVKKLTIIKNL